jgi:hypothetical protein
MTIRVICYRYLRLAELRLCLWGGGGASWTRGYLGIQPWDTSWSGIRPSPRTCTLGPGVLWEFIRNRANHLTQGVRHRAEGCVALGWNLAGVVNDPLGAPGRTPLYLCFPPVWVAACGDILNPHYSWDQYGNQKEYENRSSGPKRK